MRWSRRIAQYVERFGPTSPEQIARDLGISPARCREELEWINDGGDMDMDEKYSAAPSDHFWDEVFS